MIGRKTFFLISFLLASLRSIMKIEGSLSGSESGSISQRHGSADADPDPHQNVMDPQHWLLEYQDQKICYPTSMKRPWYPIASGLRYLCQLWASLAPPPTSQAAAHPGEPAGPVCGPGAARRHRPPAKRRGWSSRSHLPLASSHHQPSPSPQCLK